MPTRILITLLSPVIAMAAGVTTPAHAHANAADVYEHQIVEATNDVRAHHELRALRQASCLSKFADAQARRMARKQGLFHQDLGAIVRRCGVHRVAENVAAGHPSGRATVRSGWMNSAGHRANLLSGGHRKTAVGAYRDAHGLWWTAQLLGS